MNKTLQAKIPAIAPLSVSDKNEKLIARPEAKKHAEAKIGAGNDCSKLITSNVPLLAYSHINSYSDAEAPSSSKFNL